MLFSFVLNFFDRFREFGADVKNEGFLPDHGLQLNLSDLRELRRLDKWEEDFGFLDLGLNSYPFIIENPELL